MEADDWRGGAGVEVVRMQKLGDCLSSSAAARLLGASSESVRTWARSGVLPATRTPLGLLLPESAVERFAKQRRSRDAVRSNAEQLAWQSAGRHSLWSARLAGLDLVLGA